jgi:hypothetical protein
MRKNMKSASRFIGITLLLGTFSGCQIMDTIKERFFQKEEAVPLQQAAHTEESSVDQRGPVVVLIDGDPVLHKSEVDVYLNQMLQYYPQLKQAMTAETMPVSFKKTFLNKIIEQELIIAWAKKEKMEEEDSFQKSFEEAIKLVKRHLMVQEFEKSLVATIEVTDSEVRSDFNTNKSKYIKSAGGVVVSALPFEKEEDATLFLSKLKGNESNFGMLAKNESVELKTFGRVNEETDLRELPDAVKEAALKNIDSLTGVVSVKDGSLTWVMNLSDKKEAELFVFDEIKGQIEGMLRNQKFQEVLAKKMDELQNAFTVDINEEHLAGNQKSPFEMVTQDAQVQNSDPQDDNGPVATVAA